MTPGLELKDISKSYGSVDVLRDISLSVESGEMLVLLGPSGSGKSTLLRVIAGLIVQDAGDVLVGGKLVNDTPPARRDVAMVFQSYALFPHLTVYENLAFGLEARGVRRRVIEEKVGRVADVLRLTALLKRYPREASGGERQRVALGRAMLREPAVFLMDEPLSNLDAQLRTQMRAEIVRLHEQLASTMVYVTHDQLEALSMGDKIGVLRDGRLEQIGTADEIYRNPRTLFVAEFVGNPMMNIVPVEAAADGHLMFRGHAIALADGRGTRFKDAPDRKLSLGIRPEDISIRGSKWAHTSVPETHLNAAIRRVEMAGDQQFLYLDVDGETLTARCEPGFRATPGEQVEIWFDGDEVHIFDAATGEAL